jgi:hypothetical protein
MQRLEVSCAVRPIYGPLDAKFPSVIRVTLVASKVFTHNCATG